MKLKTYEAPTLHAALRLARIELGTEAVLLDANERDEETAEARFQVTFALGAEADKLAVEQPSRLETPHWKTYLDAPEEPAEDPQPEAKPAKRRSTRKKAAKTAKRKRAARGSTSRSKAAPEPKHEALAALRTPQLAAIYGRLVGVGVAPAEATGLALRAAAACGSDDDAQILEAAVAAELDAGWFVYGHAEPAADQTRVLALVGPAGAGKSTTAVKAARLLMRVYDRRAVLLSAGRHPVGGVEVLESWATLLGLQLEIVESAALLGPTLERLRAIPNPPGAIVVDTPADLDPTPAPAAEVHLVLPAAYSPPDLARTIERYSPLQPDAAVVTRLDEAAAPGSLWNLQRTTPLPVSFLGCGPNAPADLQPATPQRLTRRLLAG